MAYVPRTSHLITLQAAVTGASPGVTVENPGMESAVIEISGTYTNLEATFEVSVDGGVQFWPVEVEPVSSSGISGPKLTTPGLYQSGSGFRSVTHFRAPIATTGTPTGAMTIKVVGVRV